MEFFKKNKYYFLWIALTLALGGLGALLSGGFDYYKMLDKPPLSPPSIVFPIVWSLIYIIIGFSAGMIAGSKDLDASVALKIYFAHMIVNALWPIIFFRFEAPKSALFWIVLLVIAAVITVIGFYKINKKSAYLFVPYLAWLLFAVYLNFGVAVLNP